MFSISSCFIADFKIGDNINSNLKTLRVLYEMCDEDTARRKHLRKPIIITLVSVAEAMLYDFIRRVQSGERVPTLPKTILQALKGKDYSKLTNLVSGAKTHDLFQADAQLYEQIEELRQLRNRVHIQNERNHFERDELRAFSAARQIRAEEVLEYIAKFLAANHPRNASLHGYVGDLQCPWEERWDFSP